jgi:N-acetylglucosamine kinase-like BadF-type ATPase
MFIVVESGSTKADWMVIDGEKETVYSTKGFNPYFHSERDILLELNDQIQLDLIKEDVEEIFFYGAGCSSNELNRIIEDGLSAFFINADIHVDHDLNACAYACYDDKPEIACILGTGSNSCYFDGTTVQEVLPALGYILGDEGSGNYFGKRILTDFLYGRLPHEMHKELESKGANKSIIIENIYKKPDANVYIASFMPLLIKHKDLGYSQKIIKDGFQVFIDTHVKCYDNYLECDVNFVGSLADLLQQELREVCTKNGVSVGCIIRRPLDKLVKYHRSIQGAPQKNLSSGHQPSIN